MFRFTLVLVKTPVRGPSFCQRVCPPGWFHSHERLLLIAELFGKGLYMSTFCSIVANVLFAIHLSLQRLAPQLCIRNSCCGVLGRVQYRKDARMKWWENVLLPAKPWRCGKWDWYCSGCKGNCCTWKIHCFMVSIYLFFWFFFFPSTLSKGFKTWKWFLQKTGVFSFILSEEQSIV